VVAARRAAVEQDRAGAAGAEQRAVLDVGDVAVLLRKQVAAELTPLLTL
jgi:hypothetical protein